MQFQSNFMNFRLNIVFDFVWVPAEIRLLPLRWTTMIRALKMVLYKIFIIFWKSHHQSSSINSKRKISIKFRDHFGVISLKMNLNKVKIRIRISSGRCSDATIVSDSVASATSLTPIAVRPPRNSEFIFFTGRFSGVTILRLLKTFGILRNDKRVLTIETNFIIKRNHNNFLIKCNPWIFALVFYPNGVFEFLIFLMILFDSF